MLKLTEVLSLISAVEFILCMLCSALSRTVKYNHIIWIINYSQHRLWWCTPIYIILMDTSQQVWRTGSRRKCQDSKRLWELFHIFFVKTVLVSSIRTDYNFPETNLVRNTKTIITAQLILIIPYCSHWQWRIYSILAQSNTARLHSHLNLLLNTHVSLLWLCVSHQLRVNSCHGERDQGRGYNNLEEKSVRKH